MTWRHTVLPARNIYWLLIISRGHNKSHLLSLHQSAGSNGLNIVGCRLDLKRGEDDQVKMRFSKIHGPHKSKEMVSNDAEGAL